MTAPLLCAPAARSSIACVMPSTTSRTATLAPASSVRFRTSFFMLSLAFANPKTRLGFGIWDFLFCPARRPDDALVVLRHRRHPLVDESLQAFPFVGLRRVEIALRVNRDAVHAVELARLPSAVAERRQLLQRLAIDDLHLLVHAVGHEDVFLLRVLREGDVPHGAGVE